MRPFFCLPTVLRCWQNSSTSATHVLRCHGKRGETLSTNPQWRQSIIAFAIEFEAGVSELPMASPRRKILSMRDHKIMQKACYGRHKPSPKRCQMKQGSFKRVHSWRRSNTGGKREPATPLWGPHFVTKYVPKCHRKLFFEVNIGSNEKRCLEATRMKTNSVPKLTKMLPPNK